MSTEELLECQDLTATPAWRETKVGTFLYKNCLSNFIMTEKWIFFAKGFRGDDCGFCPPGLPGGKGERGETGKKTKFISYNIEKQSIV